MSSLQGQKLIHFLYELLSQHLNEINNPQRDEVDELLTILSSCGFQPLRLGTKLTNQHMTSMEEVNGYFHMLLDFTCRLSLSKFLISNKYYHNINTPIIFFLNQERQFWDKEMLREKKIYSRRKEGAKQR